MSILIRDIPMPNNCEECQFNRLDPTGEILLCDLTLFAVSWAEKERPFDCPLIEVPTPHGRLIDADALDADTTKRYCEDCDRRKGMKNGKYKTLYAIGDVPCRACSIGDMMDEIANAPTIIESEE